jgi:hypothetical protein
MQQAIASLHADLERKASEVGALQQRLEGMEGLNHRQLALLRHALRHSSFRYWVLAHQNSHGVSHQTARSDLQKLATPGLLLAERMGGGRSSGCQRIWRRGCRAEPVAGIDRTFGLSHYTRTAQRSSCPGDRVALSERPAVKEDLCRCRCSPNRLPHLLRVPQLLQQQQQQAIRRFRVTSVFCVSKHHP